MIEVTLTPEEALRRLHGRAPAVVVPLVRLDEVEHLEGELVGVLGVARVFAVELEAPAAALLLRLRDGVGVEARGLQ